MSRTRLRSCVFLWAACALVACGPGTWPASLDAARDALKEVNQPLVHTTHAGELELLAGGSLGSAKRLLQESFARSTPGSELHDRQALALAHLARVTGDHDLLMKTLASVLGVTKDPACAELLATYVDGSWGRSSDETTPHAAVRGALDMLARRQGASWEGARQLAREQLAGLALRDDRDFVGPVEQAGVITRWRVSAPWGFVPERDLHRTLGPETRPLKDSEVTNNGFVSWSRPSWDLVVSDGEVDFGGLLQRPGIAFAEAWVALPAEAKTDAVVLRSESNRSLAVFVNERQVMLMDRMRQQRSRQEEVRIALPPGKAVRVLLKFASHDGKGFARLSLSHQAGHHGLRLAAEPVAEWSPVSVLSRPPAPESSAVQVGDGAAAIRALHALDSALLRPRRDLRTARRIVDELRLRLGSYPGLDLAEARLAALDEDLSPGASRARRRQALEKVLERWPQSIPALQQLGLIAHHEERFDDALGLWRRALEYAPDDPKTLVALLKLYVRRGWEAEALGTATALDTHREAGPRVLQELVDAYLSFGYAARAKDAATTLSRRFGVAGASRLANQYLALGQYDASASVLLAAWREHPHRVELAQRAVAVHRVAGDLEAAAELLDRIEANRPGDGWALHQRVLVALQAGDQTAADAAIDRLLVAHPEAVQVETLRSWLRGKAAPMTEIADGREVVATWRSGASAQSADALSIYPVVSLLERSDLQVRGDGTTLVLTHVVRVVQSKAGADALGEIRPPRGAQVLRVRTIRADGSVLWPESVPGKPDLSFSGLQPGDAVEWAWLQRQQLKLRQGAYLTGLSFGSWAMPLEDKQVQVTVAPGLTLVPRPSHGAPDPRITTELDGAKHYRWRLRKLRPIPREPYAVGARSFFPFVDLSVVPEALAAQGDRMLWDFIAEDYAGRIARLTRPGTRLKSLAARLLGSLESGTVAALWAASDWVKQEINATEQYNDFRSSAEQILASQKGNRILLLTALARELGLNAELLLCAPLRDGPPVDESRPLPNANRFWYPVLRAPDAQAKLVYVDPSRPYYPFGVLPEALFGAQCLNPEATVANERMTRLPAGDYFETLPLRWELDLDLDLQADGSAEGTLELNAYGPSVTALRHLYLHSDTARRRLLWQQWVSSLLPGASIAQVRLRGAHDADAILRWRAEISLPNWAQQQGSTRVVRRVLPSLVANYFAAVPPLENLLALPVRESPLRISPHAEQVRVEIRPPSGWTIEASHLNSFEVLLPWLEARQALEVGEHLALKRTVILRAGRVEPGAYPELRARMTKALAALSAGFQLVASD